MSLPTFGETGPEFRFSSLEQSDRQQIVELSSNQTLGNFAFIPANVLRLGALGAELDLDGQWLIGTDPKHPTNLAEWRHIATSGRDQYVRLVYYGYLLPLGHRAVLIIITDRVFAADPADPSGYADAYLQYKVFIRVSQPLMTYPAFGQPYGLNSWPFVSAQMLTLITPDIDNPSIANTTGNVLGPGGGGSYPQAFFPTTNLGANDVLWSVRLVDLAGTEVHIEIPLAFVFGQATSPDNLDQFSDSPTTGMGPIISAYNALGQASGGPQPRVTAPVSGTKIAYAPEVATNGTTHSGGTSHATLAIALGAASLTQVPLLELPGDKNPTTQVTTSASATRTALADVNQPAFYPTLLSSWIRIKAAEVMSRSTFDDGTGPGGVAIGFYQGFVTQGFPNSIAPPGGSGQGFDPSSTNLGSVFAGLVNNPQLNFPSDAVGGLGNPNALISGLSAAAGAIGGTLDTYANTAAGAVDEFFAGLTGQLSNFLGGLPLGFISSLTALHVSEHPPSEAHHGARPHVPTPGSIAGILQSFLGDNQIPNLTTESEPDGSEKVSYTQEVALQAFPESDVVFQPADNGKLKLVATVTISPTGQFTFEVDGTMDPFTITILGSTGALALIQIPFGDSDAGLPGCTFSAGTAVKSSFKPNIGNPQFIGVLDFVNALEQFLQNIGGSGFSIDVGPTQLELELRLSLPSLGFGVFNLDNLSLSADLVVPFLGGATVVTFGFCSQEQPFTLTVMCFGGGGYFLLAVGLTEVQSFTASFDFEGQLGMDFGIASGGISVTAGITYSYAVGPGSSLSANVSLNGHLSVLGIVSVSLTLSLGLTYMSTGNVLSGTASIQLQVSLFSFLSVTVPVTVHKQFAGSDPPAQGSIRKRAGAHDPPPTFPPTFAGEYSQTDWTTYCEAFGGAVPS